MAVLLPHTHPTHHTVFSTGFLDDLALITILLHVHCLVAGHGRALNVLVLVATGPVHLPAGIQVIIHHLVHFVGLLGYVLEFVEFVLLPYASARLITGHRTRGDGAGVPETADQEVVEQHQE